MFLYFIVKMKNEEVKKIEEVIKKYGFVQQPNFILFWYYGDYSYFLNDWVIRKDVNEKGCECFTIKPCFTNIDGITYLNDYQKSYVMNSVDMEEEIKLFIRNLKILKQEMKNKEIKKMFE